MRLALRFMQEMPRLYLHRRKPGLVLKRWTLKHQLVVHILFEVRVRLFGKYYAARATFAVIKLTSEAALTMLISDQ